MRVTEEVVKTSVEIPLEDYLKAVLLILKGDFDSLSEIIRTGIRNVVQSYDEEIFKELEKEYKDILEEVKKRPTKRIRRIKVGVPRKKEGKEGE